MIRVRRLILRMLVVSARFLFDIVLVAPRWVNVRIKIERLVLGAMSALDPDFRG